MLGFIRYGWPEYIEKVPASTRHFYHMRGELSEFDGLVIRGKRIVIPIAMREFILDKIHDWHQGLAKCRERANQSVWWPKMSGDIATKVQQCEFCRENKNTQRKEPLMPSELPSRPWEKIAVDLCELKKQNYLVVSDCYSRYLEILHMPTTTSSQIVAKLKSVFARWGIPEILVSDNAANLVSAEMRQFCNDYDFVHVTSSPHFPQSNGHAERAIQLAKGIVRQEYPLLALMTYRATPCSSTGASPAELLMGRKLRTVLPTLQDNLKPRWPDEDIIKQADAAAKLKQAYYYNRRNGVKILPPLSPRDAVLLKLDGQKQWTTRAVVQNTFSTPRSYIVETGHGDCYRRNRRHLMAIPNPHTPAGQSHDHVASEEVMDTELARATDTPAIPTQGTGTITRSGRVSKPVCRLDL